jgi:hypothetical protein
MKSSSETLMEHQGRAFRIRHFDESQTPPSGRNRYEVISAMGKTALNSPTVPDRPKVTMNYY